MITSPRPWEIGIHFSLSVIKTYNKSILFDWYDDHDSIAKPRKRSCKATYQNTYAGVSRVKITWIGRRLRPNAQLVLHENLYMMVTNSEPRAGLWTGTTTLFLWLLRFIWYWASWCSARKTWYNHGEDPLPAEWKTFNRGTWKILVYLEFSAVTNFRSIFQTRNHTKTMMRLFKN